MMQENTLLANGKNSTSTTVMEFDPSLTSSLISEKAKDTDYSSTPTFNLNQSITSLDDDNLSNHSQQTPKSNSNLNEEQHQQQPQQQANPSNSAENLPSDQQSSTVQRNQSSAYLRKLINESEKNANSPSLPVILSPSSLPINSSIASVGSLAIISTPTVLNPNELESNEQPSQLSSSLLYEPNQNSSFLLSNSSSLNASTSSSSNNTKLNSSKKSNRIAEAATNGVNSTGDALLNIMSNSMITANLSMTDDKKVNGNKDKGNKKPWYSAFVNTYKQKNEDFKRLFKLPNDEHLLVDYSCAYQREILAHGRLYISLNYLCFHANIIGWETTLIIKLKDIRQINKDKTAKIIPNAITVVLDNERLFFTSLVSRDKTYTVLFRVWQMSLADSSMSTDEINGILRSCYGDDLGYNSDDAEYEYYSKLKSKTVIANLNELTNSGKMKSSKSEKKTISSTPTTPYLNTKSIDISKNSEMSSGEHQSAKKDKKSKSNKNSNSASSSSSSSTSSTSSFSPVTTNGAYYGHRQSSSFDTSMIDTSQSFENSEILIPVPNTTGVWLKRPKSMFINNQSATNVVQQSQKRVAPRINKSQGLYRSESSDDNLEMFQDSFDKILDEDETNENEENPSVSEQHTNEPSSDSEDNTSDQNSYCLKIPTDEYLVEDNAKCACSEHTGKEMLNEVFNLSVVYLWECLFGHTDTCQKYWESRKFSNMNISEWKKENNCLLGRCLEYSVDLGIAIGKAKNTENQRLIEYKPEKCIVLESESVTHGVPYSNYFSVLNRFCLTRCDANSTRLTIHSYLNYSQRPTFVAKKFIERNCMNALKDSYNYLTNLINKEYTHCTKYCHEFISTPILNDLLKPFLNSTTTNVNIDNIEIDPAKAKTLPNVNEPINKSKHISAVVSSQSKTKKIVQSKTIGSFETSQQAEKRNELQQFKAVQSDQSVVIDSNNNTLKRQVSSVDTMISVVGHASKLSKEKQRVNSNREDISSKMNQNFENQNESTHSTKLVPIQRFSFFKWQINVDTLVRIFIIAMICLMVINAMLYYKLRRIENLADSLRSDPNFVAKLASNQFNDITDSEKANQIDNWRSLITNTLTAIEKMENTLKKWDKSLEFQETKSKEDL